MYDNTYTARGHSLLSKCYTLLQHTCRCNFSYACRKCTTFPVQIFTKLINAQQHYVQIICTDFQPNWTINFESTSRNSCKALSKVWLYLCQFS